MFSIGEYVSYRVEGICKIVDIRDENFGAVGHSVKYYILTPRSNEKSTFYVPVENEALVSMMRKPLTEEEIGELLRSASERELEWISDGKKRSAYFREILSFGERIELLYLVRLVLSQIKESQESGKKVYIGDMNAMKSALELLLDEFSMAIPIKDTDELIALIEK